MIYVKLEKIVGDFGRVDYKGLDIEKIVTGSPIYVEDGSGNLTVYLAYGDVINDNNEHVTEITKEEYELTLQEENNKQKEVPSPQEEINQLKLALAEMAEAHEQEKTEMQLALAELAELVGGA